MMPMTYNAREGVRGVALISVMVVVSIVSSMAAQLLYRQHIDIERSTRIMSREQAFLYVIGLETYARDLLVRDDWKYDYYYPHGKYEEGDAKLEEWSWPIPNREMAEEWLEVFQRMDASVEARIDDLSGFLNVNGVRRAILKSREDVDPSSDEFTPHFSEVMYEKTFKALLGSSQGDKATGDELWNTLVDWFDQDNQVGIGGAEDGEYLDREPAYVTGQVLMAWPDEIRLLKGFGGGVADRLLPVFAALPGGSRRMNINNIKIDTRLMRSIPGLDQPGVVSEIRGRLADENYFKSNEDIRDFFDSLENQLALEEDLKSAAKFFNVRSKFFLFSACVRFGADRPIEIQSVLKRQGKRANDSKDKKVVVLQRRIGSGYYKGGRCNRGAARAPRSATQA